MSGDTTQPPAETLAEAMHCALKDAAAIATAEADRLAKEMPMGSRSEGTARAIAADITRLAVAALTRRAGGDAGTIDRCIEKLEQIARWSINDGRKWFNHPAANEAFEYAIAALRTVEPNAGGDAIPAGEVEELRAALRPFVAHWQPWMDATDDNDNGDFNHPDANEMTCFARVTFGDLRRARAALSTTPKPPAGGDAGADAADILDHYARFIQNEVKADDLERHPYLPHIEQVASDLRAALALPAPVVEGATCNAPLQVVPAVEQAVTKFACTNWDEAAKHDLTREILRALGLDTPDAESRWNHFDVARDMLDRSYGYGRDAITDARRTDPVAAAIHNAALVTIVRALKGSHH